MIIGHEYTKKKGAPADLPARLRVTGQSASGDWTATDADKFGPTLALSPEDLGRYYGAFEVPSQPSEDRAPSRDELHEAMAGYRSAAVPDNTPAEGASPSPEDVFAAAAAADAEE